MDGSVLSEAIPPQVVEPVRAFEAQSLVLGIAFAHVVPGLDFSALEGRACGQRAGAA